MHDNLSKWIEGLASSPVAQAALMSMALAVLRVVYDDKETTWTRVMLEGLMSGMLTLMAGLSARGLGISEAWAFVFGGVLAYVGLAVFRKTMLQIVKVRWAKEQDTDE
jgi:lambda family phage holin